MELSNAKGVRSEMTAMRVSSEMTRKRGNNNERAQSERGYAHSMREREGKWWGHRTICLLEEKIPTMAACSRLRGILFYTLTKSECIFDLHTRFYTPGLQVVLGSTPHGVFSVLLMYHKVP